ncbi:YqhA family protein [Devosia faecipullorum]|uniref:YqhA family protein n=1 Tax=Devosia faecipullorum TaxID=2755039 RepID=UPI00187B2D2E|nr:YqhA family protein [Devosia faecipullorum]MBE7732311.1 YqhA family protein [Devosia faecipullorum]
MTDTPDIDNPPASSPALRVVGGVVRWLMIIPVIATFFAATALMIYGAVETYNLGIDLFGPGQRIRHDQALLHAIEIVDLFLLATVVQVVSLGLYQLYFNQDIPLPKWIKIETLDDLKSKLVGVVITVLAVFFLGEAMVWSGSPDIIYLGAGVAIMIAALTYFLRTIHN